MEHASSSLLSQFPTEPDIDDVDGDQDHYGKSKILTEKMHIIYFFD